MIKHRKSKCKGCGASIIWATTSSGKRMPFDAEPKAKEWFIGLEKQAHYIPVYTPHWVTCPKAKDFRKDTSNGKA